MKHSLPSLDALKVFESAARHLSFTQAAEELCITKGAVSYQIRKLETNLDYALFRRSIRQVYLTEAGQQLLRTTQSIFAEMTTTLERINPGDNRHDVLIGVTTYVALRWLSPRLSGFAEVHPKISILLQHSVNADDFRIQQVDFAIRWTSMLACTDRNRSLQLPMPLFPVCSPELLAKFKNLTANRQLEIEQITCPPHDAIPLLCEDRSLDLWQAWYGQQALSLSNPRRIIADANVRTQAAIDGQGWTMADALMQHELDSGLLVSPFADRLDGFGYAIETAAGRFASQNASALKAWLLDSD